MYFSTYQKRGKLEWTITKRNRRSSKRSQFSGQLESPKYCQVKLFSLYGLTTQKISRYEGAFEKDKKLHICMEFCEGGDLSEKIKKQNGVLFGEEQILGKL